MEGELHVDAMHGAELAVHALRLPFPDVLVARRAVGLRRFQLKLLDDGTRVARSVAMRALMR